MCDIICLGECSFMSNNTVDFSDVVMDHFARTGALPAKVLFLDTDRLRELIDAIPTDNQELINLLKMHLGE